MAENPLRNDNRINQIKSDSNDVKQSITLYDVDYAIMTYLQDVVLPPIDDNGQSIRVPVVYGNSERWNGARRDGVYRDGKGRIQLPIMMLRRTSVAKNDAMPMLNRHVSYQTVTKWSKDNRYSRFALLGNQEPKYKVYNITMPDYVEITYECMGWANFTEHLNSIVESLTWASDEYWGDKKKYKFITTITDYNIVNEVNDGAERINRVEFSLNVKAYLLPEQFDGEKTTKKGFSSKAIVFSTETDLTGNGRLENLLLNPTDYNANKDMVDFLSLNSSIIQSPVTNNTITFSNIKLIKAPGILASVISGNLTIDSIDYDVKIYKNSTKLNQNTDFSVTYSNNNLIINFTGVSVTTSDDVTLSGKYITL
jgi:hypothetical protein